MIFGVGPAGIYVTNPLQCLPEEVRQTLQYIFSTIIFIYRKIKLLLNPIDFVAPARQS